ncbi:hypothetical protein GOV07_04790 [Candidatus Woesearchaeota archaeon]|nr:hypothetical protein [Candidatus Woesearchaeota archaeon]
MSMFTRVKYPKIPYLGERMEILDGPVHVFEKLDGANCQIRNDYEHLVTASRSGGVPVNLQRTDWWNHFTNWANRFYSSFQHDLAAPLNELIPEHLVLFGEWLSPHTLEYPAHLANKFYLLDVFDKDKEQFLPHYDAVNQATIGGLLPLPSPPLIASGRFTYSELESLLPGSLFRDGDKEGLVIKDYEGQRFAKMLNHDFAERRDAGTGMERYLTERRIEKALHRFVDDGRVPTRQRLYDEVMTDLRAEMPARYFDGTSIKRWFSVAVRPFLDDLK